MDYMAKERTPGNAIQIYQGGNKVFEYATGYADLETKTPLTGNEYYNVYSCSKVATVTAALQLLERGKFLLSDPLYDYIPEYKTMYIKQENGELVKAKNPITIENLFNMTAGFTYNLNTEGIQKARALTNGKMDTVTVVKCMAQDPLSFEPGEVWQYSVCHDVLAGLVSVITGMSFGDYMKKYIFDPLEMNSSVYHHTPEILSKMATQYRYVSQVEEGAYPYGEGAFVNIGKEVEFVFGEEYDSGGAGICSTVSDFAKFTAALANYGRGLNGEQILSRGTVELMRTNSLRDDQHIKWPHFRGYGYGLGVRTMVNRIKSGSTGSVGEFGWCGAAGSMTLIDPDRELGVFYAQHTLNAREEYYMPRLRNILYTCLDR